MRIDCTRKYCQCLVLCYQHHLTCSLHVALVGRKQDFLQYTFFFLFFHPNWFKNSSCHRTIPKQDNAVSLIQHSTTQHSTARPTKTKKKRSFVRSFVGALVHMGLTNQRNTANVFMLSPLLHMSYCSTKS